MNTPASEPTRPGETAPVAQDAEPASPANAAASPAPAPREDVLIVLPVRNLVLFPGIVLPVSVGRSRSLAAAQEAVRTQRPIGLLLQKDPGVDDPGPDDLHAVGTMASVVRFITAPDGAHHLIVQGEQRFTVLDWVRRDPFLVARIETHRDTAPIDAEIEAQVPPPCLGRGSRVLRLELPYGWMRRRIELPPGRYTVTERRLERGCLFLRLVGTPL